MTALEKKKRAGTLSPAAKVKTGHYTCLGVVMPSKHQAEP